MLLANVSSDTVCQHWNRHELTAVSTNLVVKLTLSLALGQGLTRQSKIGEVELGALGVRSQQLGFLGVQERQSLGAWPVRLDTHGSACENGRFRQIFSHTGAPQVTEMDTGDRVL